MSHSHARRGILLTAGALAAALALTACGGSPKGTSGGGGNTNFVTDVDGIATLPKGKRPAPSGLAGETLRGDRLDVADLKGRVVVLNLWGDWCNPCRAEAPHFAKVAGDLKPRGVEFVGINTRSNRGKSIRFEEDFGIPYPSLYDRYGKIVLNGFPKGTVQPQAIPSTVVLDRDGRIAARVLKAVSEKELRSMIAPVLAEKADGQ
ncbi:TlpA family protein disulfide reductase [Streptomyces somaliensis]|uniref:TlpA family protein disulfide reductase n=1 Tax=Streptomyces somaliensis (strain ATCC 33201 / DSM 40738 / JCM 12659 / KCTC 9044 / NCTC 11332 / NRRL B-12077 / IP 733) TaxID=1134445 RepID=A0AA44DFM9_STRE0|nr:TlpA disulfide reductase family protein [Streptomyces somaliensis]MCP9945070.1 TlpA family protein disulfide reductase [Streptomyces somaliensis]MCP9961713.1 TlpA family protein disulfide reductase [Streptomyces somaliensis]MCP9974527.1 TlpA family protein disulfide reductase [Streptomyces somaliensis]MCQ0024304.1 TlpA family protein disulfide reductase [Streptomyces somaliensis DSM 40738]NKY15573.1 TlpA family protein disulfide reductase [Streptomyces somaliensis DSM 40738]